MKVKKHSSFCFEHSSSAKKHSSSKKNIQAVLPIIQVLEKNIHVVLPIIQVLEKNIQVVLPNIQAVKKNIHVVLPIIQVLTGVFQVFQFMSQEFIITIQVIKSNLRAFSFNALVGGWLPLQEVTRSEKSLPFLWVVLKYF